MKSKLTISLLILLLLTSIRSIEIGADVNTVRILSVSTEIDTVSASRVGSIEGGTRLYIKIVGHDSHTASNNTIYVGQYQCIVPEMGVNEVFITCITSPATFATSEVPLNVVVSVVGHSDSQCAQDDANLCKFTYKQEFTPLFVQVFPRFTTSNSRLAWNGLWRLTNTNQIYKMLIGDQICDRFFQGLNEDETSAPNSYADYQCDVGQLTVGGYYYANFNSKRGNALKNSRLTTARSVNPSISYDIQIVPNITAISHTSITSNGAILTLTAFGLPQSSADVKVQYNSQDCEVLSVNQISKQVTCQLEISQSSSSSLYKSGSGVRMQSFDTTLRSIQDIINDYRLPPSKRVGKALEDKIITSTEIYVSVDSNDESYHPRLAVVLTGYFSPQVTGQYIFQSSSSYQSQFFLQESGTSTDISTMTNVTNIVEGTYARNPYSKKFNEQISVSQGITLNKGENYYFESFGLAGSNNYFFMANGVRVPVDDAGQYINQPGQISQISIFYNFTKEKISIHHQDLSSKTLGTFLIYFIAPYGASSSSKATYWQTPAIYYSKNTDCETMSKHFQIYLNDVRSTCEKIDIKDSNSQIVGATWTLTFLQHRNQIKPTFIFDSKLSQQPTFTILNSAGQNLSGTFKLSINNSNLKVNNSYDISFSTLPWELESALKTKLGTQNLEVTSIGSAYDGITYYIDFYGLHETVSIVPSLGSLIGEPNVALKISVKDLRVPDNTLNYVAIENDLLSQLQASPAVTLSVNGSNAICSLNSKCILSLLEDSDAPSYTSFDDNETTQQVTISGFVPAKGSPSLTIDSFKIIYNEEVLKVISFSDSRIIAQYTQKFAGVYKPIVDQVGYGVALSSNVAELQVIPVIFQLSKSTINSFGGVTLVITGKYFSTNSNDLSVTIDGQEAQIIKNSNNSIFIFTPALSSTGTKDVIVKFKDLSSQAYAINVDNSNIMTITGINNSTPSPIQKTLVVVQGTNFGTDKSALLAYLDQYNESGIISVKQKYSINVVKAEDTSVTLLFGGGQAGNYRVRIVKVDEGSNDPNANGFDKISYNIYVTGLSLTKSSKYGGKDLVLTGSNFSTTDTDNVVLIVYSQSDSEICAITKATSTQLICTLPDMSSHFSISDTSLSFSIEVWGLLLVQAIVPSDSSLQLQITYSDDITPQVSSLSATSGFAGKSIIISGTSLPTDISKISVFFIGLQSFPANIISSTGSQVNVTLPFVPQSNTYKLVLATSDGYGKPQTFALKQGVNSYTKNPISQGGQEVLAIVSGLLLNEDPIFSLNGLPAQILSCDPQTGKVLIRFPSTAIGKYTPKFSVSKRSQLNGDGSFPWSVETPSITVVAAQSTVTSAVIVQGKTVTISGTGLQLIISAYLQAESAPKSKKYSSTSFSVTSTSATISFATAPAGVYTIYLLNSFSGYTTFSLSSYSQVKIELSSSLSVSGSLISSYAGGKQLTITGQNFNQDSPELNVVKICGNEARVLEVTDSKLIVLIPPAYTAHSLATYEFNSPQNKLEGFSTFGDSSTSPSSLIIDGDLLFHYSSSSPQCYVGVDFGSVTQVILDHFELYPRSQGVNDASALFGTIFQASNDQTNWTDIVTIGTDFHLGKNLFLIDTLINGGASSSIKGSFRYFRLYDSSGSSLCQIVELSLYGWKTSSSSEINDSLICPISVSIHGTSLQTLSDSAEYKDSVTYLLKSISPSYGQVTGGTQVTFTLNKAPSGDISIEIDGVPCENVISSQSTLTCTTGAKILSTASSLVILVNGQYAITNDIVFYYGYLWSDDATWGGDFSPISGDLVYVNSNKILIVDVPYVGILNSVVVENASIIFAHDKQIHFEAHNIIVRNGNVIIGTEDSPIVGSVRITMHGEISDAQFPTIGNKGLSIFNGSISIQGQTRAVTWTELQKTASIGDTSITVFLKDSSKFDWKQDEEIVIASTDFQHGNSERRFISDIKYKPQEGVAIISFKKGLTFRHVSLSETYNGKTVEMRAEVGLLTRNIIFEGDDSSINTSYGAHIMLHGAQTRASIRYAEFRHTGQPQIIGRYPIHFHMVGDVSGSVVEGNAVHDSFARVLTIHATHYLHVKNNVGYNCAGHNIFLEDGIETNNIIEGNLILGTKQVWSMLQSDITCASYWITNPLNTVINNRAGGSDFYGFWYEIKPRPDGPSARSDICPQGMALGKFQGNKAHSNDRFGLRIFVLTHLKYPCRSYRDNSKVNPFENNPSYQITWSDFVSYKNHEDGVLAEEVGNMVFDNFYLLDNKQSGFNIYLTNRTDEEVILQNSVIVGKSLGNYASDKELNLTRGVITPRTDGFRVKNVHFANFDGTMTTFKSISFGWLMKKWVTGGKLTRFEGITYENVSSKKIFWENWRREIYEDIDGSLTQRSTPQWVTPYAPHLSSCTTSQNEKEEWDNGLICSNQLVRIEFSNPEKLDEFRTVALFSQEADSKGQTLGGNDTSKYYISKSVRIMNIQEDLMNGFAGVFMTGKIYSVQWELSKIDFTHMSIQLSPYHKGSSPHDTIVLKFPYGSFRETFEIGSMIANKIRYFNPNVTSTLSDQQSASSLTKLLSGDCKHGDWFNHVSGSALYLCQNSNGRPSSSQNQKLERTDVNALPCRDNCPLPSGQCLKESIVRLLSDSITWKNVNDGGIVYNKEGETTLTIPCPWTLLVDTDLIDFKKIIVIGKLKIDPTKNINISAEGIWIKGGSIIAQGATDGSPYTKNLNIELLGNRVSTDQFTIASDITVGNKVILNTGTFTLIGNPPGTTSTRLTAPLEIGSNTIKVESVTGWVVGDKIAIAPTQTNYTENEMFEISQISNTTITLKTPSLFYHYGASGVTITETWKNGNSLSLDLRAQVLHLTRNIKISGELTDSATQWGGRILNYYWVIEEDEKGKLLEVNKQTHQKGILNWNGVETNNCGQADTVRGAIDFNLAGSDVNNTMSVVKNSVIQNCPGICINIEQSADITLINNNIYNSRPISLRIFDAKNLIIQNNHFVAARARDYVYDIKGMLYDFTGHISFYSNTSIIQNKILISNNIAQGSEGPCLVFPHVPCSQSGNFSSTVGIFNNVASSCYIGAMFSIVGDGSDCLWAGRVAVARSERGVMINPTTNGIVVENILAAENERSVILRFAHESVDNTGVFQYSSVFGVAITNDSTAYNSQLKARSCTNRVGTQNLAVTRAGETFPLKNLPVAFDVICTSEVFDSHLHQVDVKYYNFKKSYSESNLQYCSQNMMMATHPSASDATAGTYNIDVSCTNCDEEAFFLFRSPSQQWSGWFGGCGLFLCTGPENVLNIDFTGSLFSNIATSAISHNDGIITSQCKKQPGWNEAYSCPGTNYAQLEWESQASDFNTRSSAPVYLTSQNYSNKINMFREWSWNGNEPNNLRENRFLATVLTEKIYNIEYNGLNPYNIIHKIQRRTQDVKGEPSLWVVLTSTYNIPQNIQISVDDQIIESFLPSDNVDLTTKANICGANIYDFQTRTIKFVVNGAATCIVRAKVLDTVRVHLKATISSAEFFSDSNKFSFLSKISAYLKINFSQIKIVGAAPTTLRFLQTSSSLSDFTLVIDITSDTSSFSTPADTYAQLNGYSTALQSAITSNSINIPISSFISSSIMVSSDSNGGTFGTSTISPSTSAQQEEKKEQNSDKTLSLILGIVIGATVVVIGLISYFAYKRYKQRKNLLSINSQEPPLTSNSLKDTAKILPFATDPSMKEFTDQNTFGNRGMVEDLCIESLDGNKLN